MQKTQKTLKSTLYDCSLYPGAVMYQGIVRTDRVNFYWSMFTSVCFTESSIFTTLV